MDKEQFVKSEAAVIIAKNGVDSPSLPAWITAEQKEQFRQLSEHDKKSVIFSDRSSRGQSVDYKKDYRNNPE